MIERSAAERRAKQAREEAQVDEVVLPLDLLAHALAYLPPQEIANSSFAHRHFKVAAKLGMVERGRRLGLLSEDLATLSRRGGARLEQLEKDSKVAIEHLPKLDVENSRDKLRFIDRAILSMHAAKVMAHIDKLVKDGAHLKCKTSYFNSELEDVLGLLTGPMVASYVPKLLTLVTTAKDRGEATKAFRAVPIDSETAMHNILKLDPNLDSFKVMLAPPVHSASLINSPGSDSDVGGDSDGDMEMYDLDVDRMLGYVERYFPKPSLSILKDDLERVSKDPKAGISVRTQARKLLIDISSSAAGLGSGAGPSSIFRHPPPPTLKRRRVTL